MFGLKVIGNGSQNGEICTGQRKKEKKKNISSMGARQMVKKPEGYIWTEGYWKK